MKRLPVLVPEEDARVALIHLYRAEVGRMTAYRTRLDTTTNWAVGTTAAIVTFVLSNPNLPHYTAALALFLDLIFLWMEARRFGSYELIRKRVRLLEEGFYVALLGGEPLENWHSALTESLRKPIPAITLLQAMSVRTRRNYLWLLVVVYLSWMVKIDLDGPFPDGAAMGPIPGWTVLVASLGLFLPFLVLAALHRPAEEG
ncbi:MAG TPA: DUF2270 domain-containing protein [Polyangiaceae bacterium]|nr:DUF2270 domain-containing protein [Polyangiaceae bacterium]